MSDREKLIEWLKQMGKKVREHGGVTWYDVADHLLANGVVVQKHGRWVVQNEGRTRFMCNRCNAPNYPQRFNYCPNCGAKMDEEDGDE